MKQIKKIFALVLALMLVLGMATTAYAADETYTISVNTGDTHTYEVYQIFTGELDASGKVLSNVKWGVNGTGYVADAVTAVDPAILTELENISADATDAVKLATIEKYFNKTSAAVATISKSSSYEAAPGYYLIKTASVGENDVYSTYIVKVVGEVTITTKSDVPEVEKKVKDTNDSTGDASGWQDSADHDVGDTIEFKLTATLPENYDDYKEYYLQFTDTFENMKEINITSVYLANAEGTKINDFADADYAKNVTENSFTVTFDNLKASSLKASIKDSYQIVVEYTAVLAESATSGTNGNDNTVKITYSNDPNHSGEGTPTGETPEDKVVVFTFDKIINKVDEENQALAGAGFTLYKYDADATTEDKWVAVGKEVTGTDMTQFTWHGLDDGKYKLVETTTPDGYNTIAPIEFEITSVHDTDSDDPKLTDLKTTFDKATTDLEAGSMTGTVMNQAGATLPETGGIGTTIFYAVGGLLVVAAVILLVTKKRMASAE